MHFKKNLSKRALAGVAALALTASAVMTGDFFSAPQKAEAASSDNYAKLLQYSLFLYDANMCGSDVADKSLLTWRGNCHTSDLGGFHDAGDHAIFGLPEGYSAATLGWGYYEFKDSYDKLGLTAHFKTITDHFADFIKKATKLSGNSVSSLCYQVGDAGTDHSYWGPPEEQGSRGETHWTSGGSGDIAAEYAAALALNYINFGNAEDLTYAKALYEYAKNHSGTTVVPGIYESDSYNDDLSWAAGWMYLATKDSQYKSNLFSGYLGYTHCWNNVSVGAACVAAHITGDWSTVNSYLGNVCSGSNYFFQDTWGSARHNTTAQFTALVASKNSSADYTSWCKGQMDYILGNNPSGTCFVVGFASNSAKQPHHRAASGIKTDGTPAYGNPGNVLVGALVGGPTDQGGSYTDTVTDFKCNEVAIDYNAGFVGAAAGLYNKYKTGTVDSTVVGAKSNGVSGSIPSTSTTTTTTAPKTTTPSKTTTTPASSTGAGVYEYDNNKNIVYSELPTNDKMIGFDYADFGIKSGEHVTKVEVNISSSKTIGKWQGAFGSSTSVSPDYWTQTDDQTETFTGKTGTLTWEPDSATSKIIQTQYGGQFKFGVWWIDCGEFTIDSVKVYTDAAGTATTKPSTTTTKPTTTTTKPTTTPSSSSGAGVYKYDYNKNIVYSELPTNDKMIGFDYADFGIKPGEHVTKVEVNISSSKTLGKWQGAFGSSTSVSPDYWTQTDDQTETFTGKTGTLTWEPDSATSKIIQTQYGGQFKFGVWWIDCGEFTIDSIKIYTDAAGTSTTTKPTTTTTKPTTTTTKPTTTTTKPATALKGDVDGNGSVTATDVVALVQAILGKTTLSSTTMANADLNGDGRLSIIDLIKLKNMLL